MQFDEKELLLEILAIGKNMAGIEQFLVEVRVDMRDRRDELKEIRNAILSLKEENQKEIQRFVKGMNDKMEKQDEKLTMEIQLLKSQVDELEAARGKFKFLLVVAGIVGAVITWAINTYVQIKGFR
jgi:glycyl-tRNA synthetase (class II)